MKILSFDIEEWFHILDVPSTQSPREWTKLPARIDKNVERLLAVLTEQRCAATFFCLGWIAEKHPEVIRKISDCGHELGSHSHLHPLVYRMTRDEFASDLDRSIKTLEDVSGRRVRAYRAPGFSITRSCTWAFDLLLEHGMEIDSSIFPARRAHGGYAEWGISEPHLVKCKSGVLKEFPIRPGRIFGRAVVFSGGGYFRLLPYGLIRYMTNQSDYIMTYFHPRDFDPDQPVLDLPMGRRFKAYTGLKSAQSKLERWVAENHFVSLAEAENGVDWSTASVIDIDQSR